MELAELESKRAEIETLLARMDWHWRVERSPESLATERELIRRWEAKP